MSVGAGDGRRELELHRLQSGHRAVSPVGCPPEDFKLSDDLAKRFPPFVIQGRREGQGAVFASQ
eukprot:2281694-Pyramimonas_sp.AAC.1